MSIEKQVIINSDDPRLTTDEKPDVIDALIVGAFVDEGSTHILREFGHGSHRCFDVASAGASLVDIGPVDLIVRVEHVDVVILLDEALEFEAAISELLLVPPHIVIGVEAIPEDESVSLSLEGRVRKLNSLAEPVVQIFETSLQAVDSLRTIPVVVGGDGADDWPITDFLLT